MRPHLKTSLIVTLLSASFLSAVLIYALRKTAQETEVRIDATEDLRGLGYSGQRKIAVDSAGNIFAAYRKKYRGKSEIFVAKISRQKNEWLASGTDVPIAAVGKKSDQRVPSIDIDSKDRVHVIWYGADSDSEIDNRQIKYSRSIDGGATWSSWKNIAPVDGYGGEDYWQEHPHLLVGDNDVLFAVWEGKDANHPKQQIKFSRSDDGGATWIHWKNVRTTPDNTQSRPTIVQERSGRLHLLMYSSFGNSDDRQQIQHGWSDDSGESWNGWQAVSDPVSDSRHVSAALGPNGKLHIAWRSQDASGYSQIVYRSLENGAWSEIITVAPSSINQFFPSIGIDDDGKSSIAWMESEEPSNLPNENPPDGKIRVADSSSGTFSLLETSGNNSASLYPHLPEKLGREDPPLIFESFGSRSKEYVIYLKFIRK
ncbi:MAG: sialidase family protein [Candidatus Moranbacteria bacterium]|nr:sialidase family protein [Candidatus Moranbacteria bacterium]